MWTEPGAPSRIIGERIGFEQAFVQRMNAGGVHTQLRASDRIELRRQELGRASSLAIYAAFEPVLEDVVAEGAQFPVERGFVGQRQRDEGVKIAEARAARTVRCAEFEPQARQRSVMELCGEVRAKNLEFLISNVDGNDFVAAVDQADATGTGDAAADAQALRQRRVTCNRLRQARAGQKLERARLRRCRARRSAGDPPRHEQCTWISRGKVRGQSPRTIVEQIDHQRALAAAHTLCDGLWSRDSD